MCMKKSFFYILLICLAPFAVQSQALIALLFGDKLKSDKIKMGLFIGEQSSYILGAHTVGFRPNLSFTIGAYIDVKLEKNEKWILQNYIVFKAPKGAAGLDIEKEKLSFNPLLDDNMNMIKRNITYFQFTPVMRYCFTPSWSIGLGPYVGLRMLARDTYSNRTDNGVLNYRLRVTKVFSLFDFGTALDFQGRLMKGKGLQINLRYEQGLINIYKKKFDKKGFNMAFHLGVGIPMANNKPPKEAKEKKTKKLKTEK